MPKISNVPTNLEKEVQRLRQEVKMLKEKDINNREKLQELDHKLICYELAASGANDGLWDWDLVNDELFISSPWLRMLGYDDTEFPNIRGLWESLLHSDDKEKAVKAFQDCVKGKTEYYDIQFRLKHKDGDYRWIHSRGTVLKDVKGKVRRISGSHTDITNTKFTKEALGQSELKYRNLFQNSLIAMFRTYARTGEIIDANAKMWEILQVDPQPGITTLQFYVNPEDRANLLKALKQNQKIEEKEIQLKRGDGETFWASFSAVYYQEEDIIECVLLDITKIKESFFDLQKLNYELDNFVYHASHDLRSPLRSIMGLLNLLRLEDSEAGRENCIEMIEGSIKRLDNLVIDLLQISRNSRVSNPLVEISFVTEINNSITNFYHVEDSEDVKIITKIYQPVTFTSDLTRVRIILNNLISNAIKYRSLSREQSFIAVEVVATNDKAIITVEDNGEGIPQAKLSNIFDMFFRATENSQGSGLGLYIVKNVIDKLGGKISVDSKENQGTIFKVELPNQQSHS